MSKAKEEGGAKKRLGEQRKRKRGVAKEKSETQQRRRGANM